MSEALVGAISALIGTAVGAGVTLLSQARNDRTAREIQKDARRAELRAELRRAASEFLTEAQAMERVATASDSTHGEKEVAAERMWAAYKAMLLICPDSVREPLRVYADTLHREMWAPAPRDHQVWDAVMGPASDFTEEVRRQVGAARAWSVD